MDRVLALELDPQTRAALDAQAPVWNVTVEHEGAAAGLRRLKRDEAITLVVVGRVSDPVRTVQRTQMSSPGLPVVLIGSECDCDRISEALRFTPFISGEVRCLPWTSAETLVEELRDAIERAGKRRQHEATLDALNQRISIDQVVPAPAAAGVLGALLEVAPIGVALTSADGLVRAINPRALQLLDLRERGCVGRSVWECVPHGQRDRIRTLLKKLDAGASPRSYDILSGGQKGQNTLHVSGAALTERAGGPGYLLVIQDVTERQALIEQLRLADQRKDEFLAMLGHELRNPLAPIRTALELMRLRGDAGNERERAVIERHVQHLVELVDDLLDVSRITRGTLTLTTRPIEAAAFIAEGIEMASPLIEQRRHALKVDVPRSGLVVSGDPRRLAQVVANLLSNAAKYTDAGGSIYVSGRRERDEVVLAVRDTGRGIDPALLPRIFDIFVQAKRSIDRGEGGLGIGLAIVRNLVTMHGGQVSVTSEPGEGSEVVVRLPALESRSPSEPAPIAAAEPRPAAAPGAVRVLVVDDNEDAAVLLAELLRAAGFAVAVACDGPSALHQAPRFAPEIAILDIGLPVMNGYELAGRLVEIPGLEDLALIAVSGYGGELDRNRSREAGFQEHLVKPVSSEALLAAVEFVLPSRAGR